MTAGEIVTVIVAVVCLGVSGLAVFVLFRLVDALRDVRECLDEINEQVQPAVIDLRENARSGERSLERIETMLDTSEFIAERVDSASRIAYSAFAKPVIKAGAVKAGTTQAVRKLRGRD